MTECRAKWEVRLSDTLNTTLVRCSECPGVMMGTLTNDFGRNPSEHSAAEQEAQIKGRQFKDSCSGDTECLMRAMATPGNKIRLLGGGRRGWHKLNDWGF